MNERCILLRLQGHKDVEETVEEKRRHIDRLSLTNGQVQVKYGIRLLAEQRYRNRPTKQKHPHRIATQRLLVQSPFRRILLRLHAAPTPLATAVLPPSIRPPFSARIVTTRSGRTVKAATKYKDSV